MMIGSHVRVMVERMRWEEEVKSGFDAALAAGEFIAWYQPKYSARTKQIAGAEALVRWRHNGALVPPNRFIPVLEKSGQISRLDEEIFRRVCHLQASLRARGLPQLPISVNLSRASIFTRDVADLYTAITAEYGVDPKLVPIEITESAAIRAISIRRFADALIDRGFVLHMDDFGSGYSSLASLQVIPFQSIKLDKTLIDNIGRESSESLLKHTIAYARESGKVVIAEGVETAEQYLFLRAMGCDLIQGYYFSRPVEEAAYVSLLEKVKV